jgi:hypothetical protein
MKTMLVGVSLLFGLLIAMPAQAEKIDCESLAQLGSGLDDIRNGLKNGEEVDQETYDALAQVMDSLRAVAEEEKNNKLDNALTRLETAHQNNDRDGFVSALEDVDKVFGAFYNGDCGE